MAPGVGVGLVKAGFAGVADGLVVDGLVELGDVVDGLVDVPVEPVELLVLPEL